MRRRVVVARRDFWTRVSRREEKDWINILFFYAAGWSGGDEGIALMWVG